MNLPTYLLTTLLFLALHLNLTIAIPVNPQLTHTLHTLLDQSIAFPEPQSDFLGSSFLTDTLLKLYSSLTRLTHDWKLLPSHSKISHQDPKDPDSGSDTNSHKTHILTQPQPQPHPEADTNQNQNQKPKTEKIKIADVKQQHQHQHPLISAPKLGHRFAAENLRTRPGFKVAEIEEELKEVGEDAKVVEDEKDEKEVVRDGGLGDALLPLILRVYKLDFEKES